MKWINSQINQAIKLRCLKIVQTLLSNQEKRRMREKYFNQSLRNASNKSSTAAKIRKDYLCDLKE